ncbi:MAG: hypothetical protein AABZ39_20850 [Spirochaetota bacterium]|mgnify:CR=1 FL=1
MNDTRTLAWAGWKMTIPSSCFPLAITGAHEAGAMMVGTTSLAVMQIKWRIASVPDDSTAWALRRVKRILKHPVVQDAPARFDSVLASDNADINAASRLVWVGAMRTERLLVEIVMNVSAGKSAVKSFMSITVPSIAGSDDGAVREWSIFDAFFAAPKDARLVSRRLYAGDIMLSLADTRGRKLLLRQVYPATLALERQPLAAWLSDNAVKRTMRRVSSLKDSPRGEHSVIRMGDHALPPPLSLFGRRYTAAAVTHDTARDRLLIAAEESHEPLTASSVDALIERMKVQHVR